MNIKEILEELKNIDVINVLNQALSLVNEKREFDTSGATLAFDTRDKIKRVGSLRSLNLYFENNKLMLDLGNNKYEIINFNNRKLKAYNNNQSAPNQLSLLFESSNDKDNADDSINKVIGLKTDKGRRKYTDIFLKYVSTNGLHYSVDLINELANNNIIVSDNDSEDTIPGFFQPKKLDEKIIDDNN